MNLLRPILWHAIRHPRRVLMVDDQRTYTALGTALGAMFVARAIDRTSRAKHIGVMLPTSGAFGVALLGGWLARRVVVPVNYLLAKEELQYLLRDSDIDTLITVDAMLDHVGGPEVIPPGIRLLKMDQIRFRGFPPLRRPPVFDDDETAVMLYTSGTSGRPKGVMLTHGNLFSNVTGAIAHAAVGADQTLLGVLPQFHSFGLTILTLLPLYAGARVVFSARFVPRRVIELIRRHRPSLFVAVPSMYGALLSVKSAVPDDFTSIALPVSGGEPLPDAVYETFRQRFGVTLLEGYGLTETSPASHWSTPAHHKRHAVGKPLPGVSAFILDDQGRFLGTDEEGEIILAGPNLMKGYYKLPDQTAEVLMDLPPEKGAFRGRGFRTGDIGKIDAEGYLHITGRKKEMLIIGGENVFPREIEEVLNKCPGVKASAVVGRKDDLRGEIPIAFVEVEDPATFDRNAVRDLCREQLAQFKIPRDIRVIEQLPRNPTGKILRRKLPAD